MYVITNHNEQNFVILGPVNWNPRYMSSMVSSEIDQDVTITSAMEQQVPFDVVPGVTIRKCTVQYDDLNPKIEFHNGPTWTYNEDGTATAHYYKDNKNIDLVKGELKNIVSAERYKRETSGTTVTIQDTEVYVSTDRVERNNYIQKYLMLGDSETIAWKFGNTWLNLTKSDLQTITTQINTYVQTAFDWELQKINSIDSCTTLQELDAITIVE